MATSIIATTGNSIRPAMMNAAILIVEDDNSTARLLKLLLSTSGYTVCGIASTGEKAIEMAIKTKPALILMDIKLEGDMDGIAAYERIKALVDTPVVFVSVYAEQDMIDRALRCAPGGYLVKPFKNEELLQKVESVLNWQKALVE